MGTRDPAGGASPVVARARGPAARSDPTAAKVAALHYSFAQSPIPTPGRAPPAPAPVPPTAPSTGASWGPPARKPATAAEIVAKTPTPPDAAGASKLSAASKERAELELFSKLVPTASAVPRNPGRGHGGLRSTGSVAAQQRVAPRGKSPPGPLPVTVIATGGTGGRGSGIARKEGSASRLKSLSSDTSKPVLARKVAAARSTGALPVVSPEAEKPLAPEKVPQPPLARAGATRARLPSNDVRNDAGYAPPPPRSTTTTTPVHAPPARPHEQSPPPDPPRQDSRRLEEAFSDPPRRPVGGRTSSFQRLRNSGSSSRRNSGSSAATPPSGAVAPETPGKGTSDYVPANGFAARRQPLARTKADAGGFAEREARLAPTNARAEALRSAIGGARKGARKEDARVAGAAKEAGDTTAARVIRRNATPVAVETPTVSAAAPAPALVSAPAPVPVSAPVPNTTASAPMVLPPRSRAQPLRRPTPLAPPVDPWANAPAISSGLPSSSCLPSRPVASADFLTSPRDQIDEDFPSRKSAYINRPSRADGVAAAASVVRGASPFNGLPAPFAASTSTLGTLQRPIAASRPMEAVLQRPMSTSHNRALDGLAGSVDMPTLDNRQQPTNPPRTTTTTTTGVNGPLVDPWMYEEQRRFEKEKAAILARNLLALEANADAMPRQRTYPPSNGAFPQTSTAFPQTNGGQPAFTPASGAQTAYPQQNGGGAIRPPTSATHDNRSLIEVMRNLQHAQSRSGAPPAEETEEAVLPPLPDSNDQSRFDSFLRGLGLSDDDMGLPGMVSDDGGAAMPGQTEQGLAQQQPSQGRGRGQSRYYSHFS